MRTSRFVFTTILVATGLSYPALVGAQTIPSPYTYLGERQEVGVFGGTVSTGTGRFGFGPKGGPVMGLRYGIELSGPMSLEGVTQLIEGKRDIVDPGRVEGDRIIGTADDPVLTIDGRLKFSFPGRRAWHHLSPFVTFGGGIAIDMGSSATLDEILLAEDVFDFGTSFYGTMGAGTRWYMTSRFTLRADGIFSLWKIDTPPGYSDPARGFESVEDGQWVAGTGFTVALLWRW